jgi:hypothetical protein
VGRSRLVIHAPGFGPFEQEIYLRRNEEKTLGTIRLEPGATVRGLVTNLEGQPIAGAFVHLGEEEDLRYEAGRQFVTDPSGRFEIGGVTPASSRLVVLADGYSLTVVDLELPEDLLRVDPLPIVLQPNSSIDVQLVRGGQPVRELHVVALMRKGDIISLIVSDEDGRVHFEAPGQGTYVVAPFGSDEETGVPVVVEGAPREYSVRLPVD